MRQKNVILLIMGLCLMAIPTLGQNVQVADAVYHSGVVYTVDGLRTRAEAFAVKDGKFITIGSNDDMKAVTGPNTLKIDLKGKMVMPGIADTHIHALRGALTALGVSFPATASIDEIKAAVKKYIADNKLKKGDWVEGTKWGMDYTQLSAKILDEVSPDNPVLLHDWTNHLAWVNTAALNAAGITKNTPDPESGVIDRDKSGNPIGTLHDKAVGLVYSIMPPAPPQVIEDRAVWIFDKLNSLGVVNIALAQLDKDRLNAYRTLESQNKLTVRMQGHWDWNTRYAVKSMEEMAATFDTREKRGPNTPYIKVDAVKIYADGVANGHGSPYVDPYIDEPTFGEQGIDEPTLSTWIMKFDAMGLQTMTHAFGDMAVRHWINAIEATHKHNGLGRRHHLAHACNTHLDDLPRLADLENITVEISPYQLWTPDPAIAGWWPMLGGKRMNETYGIIRSWVDSGIIVSYGSDWDNIPEPDPWFALEGMITRMTPGQPENGALNPSQRIDVETAISIFTINGAINMEVEDVTGSIVLGKSADFIVINQNILEIPVENIHKTEVLRTVLMGNTVYEKK